MSELSITEKRRIVIAYDGTEDASKLFDWSIKNIVNPRTDHVILVSALSRTSPSGAKIGKSAENLPIISTTPTRINEAIEQVNKENQPFARPVRDLLQSMADQLKSSNISSEQHVLWGDPKEALPKYTQSHQVDLLIVGSRGLSTVKSVFLGSVSDKCVHECPCPVLVVRNATI
ncbi:uncharacterized protein BX664DRAFT_321560 [Halteromyces radiatus]|uniref:uncharacterized protein n=1 Tax=Halteromyces radiatus TaxID=101107 RepID=UPI00221F87CD|nr:uncharacterized protein BX664DRAFT_321560 [Halteromyces radiatus]KAI8099540.1 hypothetical protein BX664DRAFT_321560 [Halteromyces radiatus]